MENDIELNQLDLYIEYYKKLLMFQCNIDSLRRKYYLIRDKNAYCENYYSELTELSDYIKKMEKSLSSKVIYDLKSEEKRGRH